MDLRDTAEEAAFRAELRAWLQENVPEEVRGHRGGAARFDGPAMRAWSRALYDAGEHVVMEGRYTGTYRPSGRSLDAQVCHVLRFRDFLEVNRAAT